MQIITNLVIFNKVGGSFSQNMLKNLLALLKRSYQYKCDLTLITSNKILSWIEKDIFIILYLKIVANPQTVRYSALSYLV